MKYLRKFNENISVYNPKWEDLLPETITILKGQEYGIDRLKYRKANVMINSDMLQITYDIDQWSTPDTLEIDIYMTKDDSSEPHDDLTTVIKSGVFDYERSPGKFISNLKLLIDITFGDQMACEFTINKDGVSLLQHTSFGSKFDPTNTLFAIEDNDLKKLVNFFNKFNMNIDISLEDLFFLRENR